MGRNGLVRVFYETYTATEEAEKGKDFGGISNGHVDFDENEVCCIKLGNIFLFFYILTNIRSAKLACLSSTL